MVHFLRLSIIALLALHLLLPAPAARAGKPVDPPSAVAVAVEAPLIAMQHTSWTAQDGAPANITGIAQTPDGWLWISSTSGLFRFDGVRFLRAEGALAPLSSNIAQIGVLTDGTLWLSYKFGGMSLMASGRMRHWRAGERGMPRGNITGVARDTQGRVWIGHSLDMCSLAADGTIRPSGKAFGAPRRVQALLMARNGVLWARTRDGVYALAPRGTYFEPRLSLSGRGELAEHPDGSIWTSDSTRTGLRLVAGVQGTDPEAWHTGGLVTNFLFDHAGKLWLPDQEGVVRAVATEVQQRSNASRGLSGLQGLAVFEDREHNVWVGTENGLDRFRAYRVTPLALPPHPGGLRPLAPAAGGGAWVDGRFVARPGALPVPFAPPTKGTEMTTALHAGPDGTVWSGGVARLWAFRGGVREDVARPPSHLGQRGMVLSMATDTAGALWVSMGLNGVYSLYEGQWTTRVAPLEPGFSPTVVATGQRGRVWLGATEERIALLADGAKRYFGRAEGLAVGTVLAILPMADGSDGAWVGGENGLARFDGRRFFTVAGRGGEPFAGVTGIVFALDGTLWLNGAAGLSAIAPDELAQASRDPAYRVRFERIDYRDGLAGTAGPIAPLPSAIRSKDGTLWFTTQGSTFAFDPATLPRNRIAPPVFITALKAGDKAYPAQDGLRLPPRTSTLEVDFTALGYSIPERMAFRYQLEGVDEGWHEAARRSATYTNLAPGRYRFRVIAANEDGVWNEAGVTLQFEVAPGLAQTLWFRLLCGGALLAGLWLLHRMRLRQVGRRLAMQMTARLAERERIARELHDTLLQSIQGLLMKLGAVVRTLHDEEARKPLEDALDSARQVLVEGKDRVAGLRGEATARRGLAQAIADACGAAARDAGLRFEVATHGDAAALDAGVAAEVLAIVREAVWNACKHAQASTLSVNLRDEQDELRITIADDGRGISAAVLAQGGRPGHWGLTGMRERAANMGAALALETREGNGTCWTLRVPHAVIAEHGRMADAAA